MYSDPMTSFFQNLRLPLLREEGDMFTFLADHFTKFGSELDVLLASQSTDTVFDKQIYDDLREKRENIIGFCKSILDSLEFYRNGKILEAYCMFQAKMDEMQDHLLYMDMKENRRWDRFFRIRSDKGDFQRKDLFHIPFNEITKVRSYRYSVPGFPCLYLAGGAAGLSLAWFECGMPDSFSWSEFEVVKDAPTMYLVDLTLPPFTSAMSLQAYITAAINKVPIRTQLTRMITTYPLIAACSLIVKQKGQAFIPEYVIPQMLLAWVRKNGKYSGVAYSSCSSNKKVRMLNAINVALPPVKVTDDGHCQDLKRLLRLSKPKHVDISEIFRSFDKEYRFIREYRMKINTIFTRELGIATLREIISLCDSFIILLEKLRDKKTQDLAEAYQHIETLSLVADRITAVEYRRLMRSETKQMFLGIPEKTKRGYMRECDRIWKEFKNIQESFSSFRSFDLIKFPSTTEQEDFQFIDPS